MFNFLDFGCIGPLYGFQGNDVLFLVRIPEWATIFQEASYHSFVQGEHGDCASIPEYT